eukprot:CAMPEP_0202459110 /NCGR_PEP_ID=MMETSP1360-20130828/31612_1 /ASSEMBLY_ACC=CAM_ASM_000848 /TAXON_ID=515479 /ORGANISM="Licmophora paradoxa, Strain CCMP2313" /LENGTH=298 /DNA_ID=CAMNT_0049079987 /DNA_START=347 /DNA_END=1243 /DNA_ORIENTATION=-
MRSSTFPSYIPSFLPTSTSSDSPSTRPSANPTSLPSFSPSSIPSFIPSIESSSLPTHYPSSLPSFVPSFPPSHVPSGSPSILPSLYPTLLPSTFPTLLPSSLPTISNTCKSGQGDVIVFKDDFESMDGSGWSVSEFTSSVSLSTYLGRFHLFHVDFADSPGRTFTVGNNPESISVEFDFYEIDSWDAGSNDRLVVTVEGDTTQSVIFGPFSHGTNDSGSGSTSGISWSYDHTNPDGIFENLEGNSKWSDEIHPVKMSIPDSYYEKGGEIRLTFQFIVNQPYHDESGGLDNLIITARCP